MSELDLLLEEYKEKGDDFFEKSLVECPFCQSSELPQPKENPHSSLGFDVEICPNCKARFTIDPFCNGDDPQDYEDGLKAGEIIVIHNYLIDYHAIDKRLDPLFDVIHANHRKKESTHLAHLVFWKRKTKGRPREYSPRKTLSVAERKRLERQRIQDKLKRLEQLQEILVKHWNELPLSLRTKIREKKIFFSENDTNEIQ